MAIPLAYNLRNLTVRKTTTIMTALGIALTVAVLLSVLALVNGLRTAFQSTGNPTQVLVLRKGGTSELSSVMTREVYQDLKANPGIACDGNEPMASLEMVTVINLPSVDNPEGSNITLRGLLPLGTRMRDDLQACNWPLVQEIPDTGKWSSARASLSAIRRRNWVSVCNSDAASGKSWASWMVASRRSIARFGAT